MASLQEIVNLIVAAGLAADQIPTATSIVQAIQDAGLDPAAVAEAVAAATASPTAPAIPGPEEPAAVFLYLTDGKGGTDPTVPLLAAREAIEANDWTAASTALMDIYRSAWKCRPELEEKYKQQQAAKEQTSA